MSIIMSDQHHKCRTPGTNVLISAYQSTPHMSDQIPHSNWTSAAKDCIQHSMLNASVGLTRLLQVGHSMVFGLVAPPQQEAVCSIWQQIWVLTRSILVFTQLSSSSYLCSNMLNDTTGSSPYLLIPLKKIHKKQLFNRWCPTSYNLFFVTLINYSYIYYIR